VKDLKRAADYVKDFEILIFDMGKTFMYGGDRFDESQDYEASYRWLGGERLDNKTLHYLFHYIYDSFLAITRNPLYYDNVPTIRDFLEADSKFINYDSNEKDLLERVFAHHECGSVPGECREILLKLSNTHRLGIISNVWCYSKYFTGRLKTNKVYDLFDIVLFSSDYGSVKPSPKLFNKAAEHFGKIPCEIVYIGDNYKRDIIGSKNAGMKSILVRNGANDKVTGDVKPDFEIEHIRELI